VYFFYSDAYDSLFPDNVFDRMALFFSIANIAFNRRDLVRLFMELRRVLRKGGLIGISEPFVEDFPKNLGEVLRQLYAESHNGETLLYLSDVVWALRKTNFGIVEMTKIELGDTGADVGEAKEYLGHHYGVPIPGSVLLSIRTDRIWVHDDPPGYTMIVAKKR